MLRSMAALLLFMSGLPAFAAVAQQTGHTTECAPLAADSVHVLGSVREPGSVAGPVGITHAVAQLGGLRESAYGPGAILLRPTREHGPMSGLHGQAVVAAWQMRAGSAQDDASIQNLSRVLVTGTGYARIPVQGDPSALRARPHLDTEMLPGDVLVYPARPTFIAVVGHVRAPGLYAYEPGKAASDYIRAAQGFAPGAARSATYAVGPDGSTRDLHVEYWNYQHETLLPGSVIHIPTRREESNLAEVLVEQLHLRADGVCAP